MPTRSWKLQKFKGILKKWNSERCGNFDLKVKILEEKIDNLEATGYLDGGSQEELAQLRSELWETLRLQEVLWRQKSRMNWMKLGDSNTAFFHKSVKIKMLRRGFEKIKVGNRTFTKPAEIKEVLFNHFQLVVSGA
ncbi:hypothetical protein V6N13_070751 [Hibiscus sabdariffa]